MSKRPSQFRPGPYAQYLDLLKRIQVLELSHITHRYQTDQQLWLLANEMGPKALELLFSNSKEDKDGGVDVVQPWTAMDGDKDMGSDDSEGS